MSSHKAGYICCFQRMHHNICLLHVKHDVTSEYCARHADIKGGMWLQAKFVCSLMPACLIIQVVLTPNIEVPSSSHIQKP